MNKVVSREVWNDLRGAVLKKEKEFTRARDALTAEVRKLPWVKIEKEYAFTGPNGKETLADLFNGKSQLIVYHFMLGPEWGEGCPSCSFWADNFHNLPIHLAHRDTTFLAISRAPFKEIENYRKRMGWSFKWVSSYGTSFNMDFGVSDGEEDESPGLSIFYKEQGTVYHTYFTAGRGLEVINPTYQVLDLVPKGRDEKGLDFTMAWVKRHDEY